MNDALITEIARQIFTEQIVLNWKFYVVLLLLYLVAFAMQKTFGPYLQKRGETLATKADFDLIKNQLEETTKTTKGIELSLSHKDWSLKEYKVLRRTKLEELMVALYDTQQWLEEKASVTLYETSDNTERNAERSPVGKVTMLSLLYFPELAASTNAFFQAHQVLNMSLIKVGQKLSLAKYERKVAGRISLEEHQQKINEELELVRNLSAEIFPLQVAVLKVIESYEADSEKLMRTVIEVDTF